MWSRSNVTIRNMHVRGFSSSIYLYAVSESNIIENDLENSSETGIYLNPQAQSYGNTIRRNNITAGLYCIEMGGNSNYNNIFDNNLKSGIAGVSLYGSFNRVENNTVTVPLYGIELYSGDNNRIWKNSIANATMGVQLSSGSNYNSIFRNSIIGNQYGISVAESLGNSITANNISSNSVDGIALGTAGNNSISGNSITDNGGAGIAITYVSRIANSSNHIFGNNITSNGYGITLHNTTSERIYHNNFVDNVQQVLNNLFAGYSRSILDDGYPSGGNYWNDYTGPDQYSGPGQNVWGSDGIGDTPYIVDANNTDHYPLVNPWIEELLPTPVHNLDTGLGYVAIQEAIDALETRNGDTIFVESGTYYEHVVVYKSLTLIGENRINTVIDGENYGNVTEVTADNVTISGFTIKRSGYAGVYPNIGGGGIIIRNAGNCNVSNNIVTDNNIGVFAISSPDTSTSRNRFQSNRIAVWLNTSNNNDIIANDLPSNGGFGYGLHIQRSNNTLIIGNNLTQYLAAIILWQNLDNTVMENRILSSARFGIIIANSSNNSIIRNYVDGNNVGYSGGNPVQFGIALGSFPSTYAYNNTIVGNTITRNALIDINFQVSSNNIIYHNNLRSRRYIGLFNTTNIWDNGYPEGGNYWSGNSVIDSYSGPFQNMTGSDGVGDTPFVMDAANRDNYPFVFQNGWQNYPFAVDSNVTVNGISVSSYSLNFTVSGPTGQGGYANITVPVGINQTVIRVFVDGFEIVPPPFPIITSNSTHYFIYFEFTLSTHNVVISYGGADIAVLNGVLGKTVIGQGYSVTINATIQNKGIYEENLNLIAYANSTMVASQLLTLQSENSTTITFTWSTAGLTKGTYTISVYAAPLVGDVNPADNTFIAGLLKITIPGDVNGDWKVDISDAALIGRWWRQHVPPTPANVDINGNGTIDISDAALVGMNWGKHI